MENYTEIVMVLDRSGSMTSIWKSTIEGVNEFLSEQKKLEGKCNFTLWQFDYAHEKPYEGVELGSVDYLTEQTYVPRGSTALYDAICLAIDETGKRLAAMPKAKRPDNVMFVIMTDGEENSSHKFKMKDVNDKIKHQTEKYNWDFIFLGANQDAIATAKSFGISAGKSMTFAANDLGSREMFRSVSAYYSNVRCGATSVSDNQFTVEDRSKQSKAGA